MRRRSNQLSGVAALVAAGALAACTSSVPDFTQFKLPQPRSFLPSNSGTYVPPSSAAAFKPVSPADLVDAQGMCAAPAEAPAAQASDAAAPAPAVAPASAPAAPASGAAAPAPAAQPAPSAAVGLDMSECQVVRALGSPQSVNIAANERGDRKVVMVYAGNERAGTYEFVAGRLTSLERGAEPPPPEKPAKTKKKPATATKGSRKAPST